MGPVTVPLPRPALTALLCRDKVPRGVGTRQCAGRIGNRLGCQQDASSDPAALLAE